MKNTMVLLCAALLAGSVLAGEKWAPLCKKYECTMTQLVIGWTTAQGNGSNVNALCGARKLAQIEENARGGDIVLDAADLALMRADAQAIS